MLSWTLVGGSDTASLKKSMTSKILPACIECKKRNIKTIPLGDTAEISLGELGRQHLRENAGCFPPSNVPVVGFTIANLLLPIQVLSYQSVFSYRKPVNLFIFAIKANISLYLLMHCSYLL